jgi:fumarylacetoacetase
MPERTAQSWLAEANTTETDFPLTHLPYGAFERDGRQHLCIAIGSHLLDLDGVSTLFPSPLAEACQSSTLNQLMSLAPAEWETLRAAVTELLHVSTTGSRRQVAESALYSLSGALLRSPTEIRNYTDFYASIHHASRVGQLFRPDQPLLPNYKHIPIGYHGRASSIVASGTPIRRPSGQTRPPTPDSQPGFGPTRGLDYELELALYVGQSNLLGEPIPISSAGQHLFGVGLLNDWSARDIQSWEYQPLGPFLGKSFATSVSPWITPMSALAPFRAPTARRAAGDPKPLAYLFSAADQRLGGLDVKLEAWLTTALMRENGLGPFLLAGASAADLYWTPAQLVAHHTSNGCNLETGDVLATGTISGPQENTAGCLLELTRNGTRPVALPTGETRAFLEDGDEIILRGRCEAPGHPGIGLGECRGTILSSVAVG